MTVTREQGLRACTDALLVPPAVVDFWLATDAIDTPESTVAEFVFDISKPGVQAVYEDGLTVEICDEMIAHFTARRAQLEAAQS